ncbi:hypothetical protein FACS189483_09160 [Spirochaetia bacterium]|nr:hypothetical protein FACS189483_09160 [Spirochaetia bacterium]
MKDAQVSCSRSIKNKKPVKFEITFDLRRTYTLGIIAALIIYPLGVLGAQQVDNDELTRGSAPVNFINYEGPQARVETRLQIWTIGNGLGLPVRSGAPRPGDLSRYFVIHSVTAPEGDKLDADIFGLGVDTGVDHIRNLRSIIQGYLEGAYTYSAEDAALLANYVTIYNAVFRGNWNTFNTRYKGPVVENLVPEKAGLSIRFDEWPGQTLMVIPLAIGRGGALSAIDTTSLTAPEVIDELRTRDDMGVEQRRDMVDLKEREAEEAEEQARLRREAIVDEERRIAQERSDAAAEQERIARDRQAAAEAQAAGNTTPEEAARTEQELQEREAAAAQREGELNQREETLADQRQAAEQTEAFAEQKASEAQQERQDIARDQQSIIAREEAGNAVPTGIIGVRLAAAPAPLGRMVRINAATGAELRSGEMNTVNGRTVVQVAGKLIAVAGEAQGAGAIRLVEINPETLEMTRQGNDDIHPQSLLWVNGNDIYAITGGSGSLYLARFNAELALQAKSVITVHQYGTPSFQGNTLLIQRADGSLAVLNTGDLSEKRE